MLPRLGVNIDHIATLRQLRGTPYPNLVEAAQIVKNAGADQITVHLREDRRHINDQDVVDIRKKVDITLNLEMATTEFMLKFAKKVKPDWVCLVPEKRNEVTTEGGLALEKNLKKVEKAIKILQKNKIKVSLFIEPNLKVIQLAQKIGADAVELHTGKYCLTTQNKKLSALQKKELKRIKDAAALGHRLNIHVHAGHGFDYQNVRPVVELDLIEEFNIGHVIVCRAAMVGLDQATREMVSAIQAP